METQTLTFEIAGSFVIVTVSWVETPWADEDGRIVLGPPIPDDSIPLEVEVAPFWIVDSTDAENNPVQISSEDFRLIQKILS